MAQRKQYGEEALQLGMDLVAQGQSIQSASKAANVPVSTLARRIRDGNYSSTHKDFLGYFSYARHYRLAHIIQGSGIGKGTNQGRG
jgi:hypothetical protein